MKVKNYIVCIFALLISINGYSQKMEEEIAARKQFIGSTFFVLFTPLLDPSPEYYQLNYGYRLTTKDVFSVEAITWKYLGPLGRQYGPNYDQKESNFPGSVRAIGAGLAYKRFLWKGVYAQIHATAFKQNYLDINDKKIQSGFQLFNSYRMGYHINLFKKRFFIEPSVALTSWPINTNLPASFQVEEDKWVKYFLFEPGLHFGINF